MIKVKGISLVVEGRFGIGSVFEREVDEKLLRGGEGLDDMMEEEIVGLKNVLDGEKYWYVCGDDGLEMVVGLEENYNVEEMREVFKEGVREVYGSDEVVEELGELFDRVVGDGRVGELIRLY